MNKTKTRYFLDGGIPTRTRTWQQKPLPKCHVLEDSRASMGRQKQIEDNGLLGGQSCLIYLEYPAMFNRSRRHCSALPNWLADALRLSHPRALHPSLLPTMAAQRCAAPARVACRGQILAAQHVRWRARCLQHDQIKVRSSLSLPRTFVSASSGRSHPRRHRRNMQWCRGYDTLGISRHQLVSRLGGPRWPS